MRKHHKIQIEILTFKTISASFKHFLISLGLYKDFLDKDKILKVIIMMIKN